MIIYDLPCVCACVYMCVCVCGTCVCVCVYVYMCEYVSNRIRHTSLTISILSSQLFDQYKVQIHWMVGFEQSCIGNR